ncbi:hypothetical protein [Streptomyces mirabilis]|uniref:hypothetical protein n=1 Tax=Streptomyces mirabilis TaxID=68239 RepID=UPI0033A09C1F
MTLEPFGVDYEHPAEADCLNCPCCTARLCERGAQSAHQCHGLTPEEFRATVYNCPCSSPLTRGTHAWRLDRIRATLYATEHPLSPGVEVVLRALAQGETADDLQALARLRVAGFVAEPADEVFTVTELGQFYLDMRSAPRFPTPLEVLSVDTKARTAQCVVVGFHISEPVTLLLDQLQAETKLSAEELPGTWLEAEANCHAADAMDLVLTRITVAPPLPAGFMDPEQTPELRAGDQVGGEQA